MPFLIDDEATRPMLQPWEVTVNTSSPFSLRITNAASGSGIGSYLSLLNNTTEHMQVGINSTGHSDSSTGFIWMFQSHDFKIGTASTERFRIGANGMFSFSNTITATSATAGSASALPATPANYLVTTVNGTLALIPYYNF